MPLADRNIIIKPNISQSSEPEIRFTGADTSTSATIVLKVYNSSTVGQLSIEGNAGQLFSVVDSLTGSLFSVNDISGLPTVEVFDTGEVRMNQFGGFVDIYSTSSSTSTSTGALTVEGGVGIGGNLNIGGAIRFAGTTTLTNTSVSTSTLTGALLVSGGVGIGGNISVGGAIDENIFTITDAAAFEVNPANGTVQLITLGASRTPKATSFIAGQSVTLMVDDGTAYTITWTDSTWGTGGVTWVGGSAPTLTTSGYTVIEFWKVSTKVYGAFVGTVA